jgi:CHAT domain-containing protein
MRRLGIRVLVSACLAGCGGQSAEIAPCSGAPICAAVGDAIGNSAFCDVRLTGFHYSPSRGALTFEGRERLSRALAEVVSPARFMALRAGTSTDRHAAGVLRVVECVLAPDGGSEAVCAAAVEILEEVVESSPDAAGPRNDLAAARWLTASRSGRIERRIAALEDATLGAEQDPGSVEAAYNLAWIQEDLSLWRKAGESYEKYLELDRESEWGRQSGTRRAALAALDSGETTERVRSEVRRAVEHADGAAIERLVASHPQLVRELAQDELLIRWAREMESTGASSLSPGLSLTGSALVTASRDYTVADTLPGTSLAARGNGMFHGISAYGQALTLLNDLDYESARPWLLTATASADPAHRVESPLLRWAGYYLALEAYQRSDYETAFGATERLLRSPDSDRYPSLVARLHRVQALMYRIRGDYPRAREKYLEAAGLSHASGELGAYADQQVSLALVLHALGDQQAAWQALGEALRLRGQLFSPIGQYRLLNAAAVMLRDEVHPSAARWFQAEAVEIAEESESPTLLVEAYRELAAIEEAAGNVEGALEALAKSSEHAADVSSPSVGRFLDLENHRRAGLVLLGVDPEAAVERLSKAVEASEAIGYQQVLPGLYLASADVWLSLGREELVERDLQQAMRHVESQTEQIVLPEHRISFSAQARAVYESLVLFEWARGETSRAFAAADRPRDRLLADWLLDRGDAAPERLRRADTFDFTAERVVAALDDRSALVEFGLVGDRTLAWAFTAADGMRALELPSPPETLRASVRRLHEAAEIGDSEAADRELANLYEALIEPLALDSSILSRLIVVPHDELGRVPFSSLVNGQGHRLFEGFAVLISPSAAATAAASTDSGVELGSATALIVADPSFDRKVHPELSRLEHSLREAEEVARVYGPSSRVLTGPEATRAAFIENAPSFHVLHVASHAVASIDDPLAARIVLAASPGEPTGLTARDILELDLRGVKLVVLSTCGSAAGPVVGDASVQSLARAFLAAGAGGVVATLWRLDDAEVSSLVAHLHEEILGGTTAAEAIRTWKQGLTGSDDSGLDAKNAFEIYASR